MKLVKAKHKKGDCLRCGISKKEFKKDKGECSKVWGANYKNHKWVI